MGSDLKFEGPPPNDQLFCQFLRHVAGGFDVVGSFGGHAAPNT